MEKLVNRRASERGSAGTKLMVTLVVIVLGAHAGYNYIPVAYNAQALRGDMDTAVLQGMALPGKISPVDNVKERIVKAIIVNNISPGATLDVKQVGNGITARVTYQQQVNILPFGMYKYNYVFDYTATPTGFLLRQ
ncbi:MAG TPA: hypothetical protein VGI80_10325 [Pyrinomonadaceae bacterium]|jgi:hypothetical protein